MKFKRIDSQIRIATKISKLFELGTDIIVLDAPTGIGKSAISYLVHEISKRNAINLMHQKILQDQYDELFNDNNNVVSVKGKDNYFCAKFRGLSVSEAPCQVSGRCILKNSCEYFVKRSMMLNKPFVVSNYQLIFSLLEIGNPIGVKPLAIFDEFHNLAGIFTNYKKIILDHTLKDKLTYLKAFLMLFFKEFVPDQQNALNTLKNFDTKNPFDSMNKFFNSFSNLLYNINEELSDENNVLYFLEKEKDLTIKTLRNVNSFNDIIGKWDNYKLYKDKIEFVFDYDSYNNEFEYSLTPLEVGEIFKPTAYSIGSKFLMMSSTTFDATESLKELGLENSNHQVIRLNSPFDKNNRKIFFMNADSLNNKKLNNPKYDIEGHIYSVIKNICKTHAENKESGVILTSSYKLTERIVYDLKSWFTENGFTVIYNSNAEERNEVIEQFRDTSIKQRLLISPSFYEGVNFEDDISRFQILLKTPFMSLGSKYVSKKFKTNPYWYEISALSTLVQGCGRSVRNKNDNCVTYIIDSNATRLFKKYKKEMPAWFKEAVILM